MQFMKSSFAAMAAIGFTLISLSDNAQAQISISPTYKVQVEYWFFDTDYYYWSTKMETQDYDAAVTYYNELMDAKEAGELNSVVPNSYWRYIAVDVRLIRVYPQLQMQRYQPSYIGSQQYLYYLDD